MRHRLAGICAGIFAAATAPVAANDLAEAGRSIVTENCSPCHAVGTAGDSPDPAAPPFRTFSSRWPVEYLEEALAEGIVVGHSTVQMPEFVFEPDQIEAIITYLNSIQE